MTRGMELLDPWATPESKSSDPKSSRDAMLSLQRITTQLSNLHKSMWLLKGQMLQSKWGGIFSRLQIRAQHWYDVTHCHRLFPSSTNTEFLNTSQFPSFSCFYRWDQYSNSNIYQKKNPNHLYLLIHFLNSALNHMTVLKQTGVPSPCSQENISILDHGWQMQT